MLAFLDPARLGIRTVDDLGLLAIAVHMLAWPSRAGNDGGIDDGSACALHFQTALLQLAVDQCQQFLIEFSLDEPIAEAADGAGIGQLARAGLEAGKHHEVQTHAQRLLQLGIR